MAFRGRWPLILVSALAAGLTMAPPVPAQDAAKKKIEFNRDIRPILANNCLVCHGPDNNLRKADLRLDDPKSVALDRKGHKVVVPGEPMKSELYLRIIANEPAKKMPPAKSKRALTQLQIELLRQWIEQGGEYQGHWAFLPIKKSPLPKVKNLAWTRNPIDFFILERAEKEGLLPSEEADKRTLVRRLAFDLTGLPPTQALVDAFIADKSAKAYDKLVEQFLNSPHFGERMGLYWLDVVRYADTGGYHSDNHRDLWMYRDYVIEAFNQNKHFDQFLVEQLAGDLVPGASDVTKIASGFNRLLQTTEEGGAQAKEYQAKYYADRVRNLGGIFLGLTTGCAECHDHKFDPITTRDFYQLEAFFSDIQEASVGRQAQTPFPSPAQKIALESLKKDVATAQEALNKESQSRTMHQVKWEDTIKAANYKGIPGNIVALLKVMPDKRNPQQKQEILKYYQGVDPQLQPLRAARDKLDNELKSLQQKIPSTLITTAGPPRTVKILKRGNWLDESGEVVQPAVPSAILARQWHKKRPDRLDLASWMTDANNPLVARVFVNRLWMLFHGQGIVKTVEDFGTQGALPTHPDLLNWLAAEFQGSGWDIKHMVRLMVTSATYRQTSKVTAAQRKHDPYNELFARQMSFRLDAEFVRDNALAISGLLSHKLGGPSVKPYQPPGYWKFLNFPTRDWVPDKGEDQYRRGLYTYWQRTFLHPGLQAFDASTREECSAQRSRSNTPQQALVLLNDPTYVEAARVFAEKLLRTAGPTLEERIDFAFLKALNRKATATEVKVLTGVYQKHLKDYQADPKAAQQLISVGFHPVPGDLAVAELAAMTSVTRVILNLSETITRE
jgi:hypothetical protein